MKYSKSDEIKELERLYHKLKISKSSMPHHTIPYTRFSDKDTKGLTNSIVAYCSIKNIHIERVANIGRMYKGKWVPGSGMNGTADLHAIYSGRAIKIEVKCKYTKDQMRPAQVKYQERVNKAGGIYVVITEFKDFYYFIKSLCYA